MLRGGAEVKSAASLCQVLSVKSILFMISILHLVKTLKRWNGLKMTDFGRSSSFQTFDNPSVLQGKELSLHLVDR